VSVLLNFWDVLRHLDQHLADWSQLMGGWLYLVLFLIVFAETGLVVTPFLPGDSLMFAVGALCAVEGSALHVALIIPLLLVAAVVGDAVNYAIGRKLGPRVFTAEKSLLLNKKHLLRTQEFYERYGGKTIIIARFVPIVRTFAPFVAGIGQMRYPRFFMFNGVGALLWVIGLVLLGYAFGNLPVIKKNFSLVIFAIIGLSILPAVIEILRGWRASRRVVPSVGGGAQGNGGPAE
jgi:membrane-associated protein